MRWFWPFESFHLYRLREAKLHSQKDLGLCYEVWGFVLGHLNPKKDTTCRKYNTRRSQLQGTQRNPATCRDARGERSKRQSGLGTTTDGSIGRWEKRAPLRGSQRQQKSWMELTWLLLVVKLFNCIYKTLPQMKFFFFAGLWAWSSTLTYLLTYIYIYTVINIWRRGAPLLVSLENQMDLCPLAKM